MAGDSKGNINKKGYSQNKKKIKKTKQKKKKK